MKLKKALVHDIPVLPDTGFGVEYEMINDSRHLLIIFNINQILIIKFLEITKYILKKTYKKKFIKYNMNSTDLI